MSAEVFEYSCAAIAEAIREVAANPPREAQSIQDAVADAVR